MLTETERRRLAAALGWDAADGALGAYEAALNAAYGTEQPVTGGASGGEAFPRRARARTLYILARRTLGETDAAAAFHGEAERVKACWYLDPGEALDALAAACGICKESDGQ